MTGRSVVAGIKMLTLVDEFTREGTLSTWSEESVPVTCFANWSGSSTAMVLLNTSTVTTGASSSTGSFNSGSRSKASERYL